MFQSPDMVRSSPQFTDLDPDAGDIAGRKLSSEGCTGLLGFEASGRRVYKLKLVPEFAQGAFVDVENVSIFGECMRVY